MEVRLGNQTLSHAVRNLRGARAELPLAGARAQLAPDAFRRSPELAQHTASTDVPTATKRFFAVGDGHSALNNFPQLVTALKQARLDDPHLLMLYNGDAIIGTPYFDEGAVGLAGNTAKARLPGLADYQAIDQLLKPASFVIGNHDLDKGYDAITQLLSSTNLAVTNANWKIEGPLAKLTRTKTDPFTGAPVLGKNGQPVREKMIQPYRVFTNPADGTKVAVVGLSIDPAQFGFLDKRITYLDPADTLRKLQAEIHAKHPGALVVAQTHIGADDDAKLAGQFPDVVFFAAHDHKALPVPQIDYHAQGLNGVTDDGASYQNAELTAITHQGDQVTGLSGGTLHVVDPTIQPDAEAVQALAPVEAAVTKDWRQPLATLTTGLGRSPISGTGDSPEGEFLVDHLKRGVDSWVSANAAQLPDIPGRPGEKGVDLAWINNAGRADIPKGTFTRETGYNSIPFDNKVEIVDVPGALVQAGFDNAAGRGGDPVASASATLDRSAGKASDVTVGGQPLDPSRTYRVALLDYMFDQRGSGYGPSLGQGNKVAALGSFRDMFTDQVAADGQAGPITPPKPTPRLTILGANDSWQQHLQRLMGLGAPDPKPGPPPAKLAPQS